MFEIGSSLREARVRRGLELADAEAATKIRSKYLQALEEERFDLLPGDAYARGFLRSYAEYLGLEASLYVDQYNARFVSPEEPPLAPRGIRAGAQGLNLPLTRPVVIGALLAALLAVLAWQFGGSGDRQPDLGLPPPAHPRTAKQVAAPAARQPRRGPKPAKLVLTAARGRCWLAVHVGSRVGSRLYVGTLEHGQSIRFAGKRLWIRFGAPSNLVATLGGKPIGLPKKTSNVIVTADGIRTVESN